MPRIVITEPDKTGQPYRFELERELVTIGRRKNSDITLECRSTSGDHCTMERVDGGFILRDQDSTNGIKQGKAMMQIIDLKDGMEVSIGDVTLDFQLSKQEIETLSEESFMPHEMEKQPASPVEEETPKKGPLTLKENTSTSTKHNHSNPAENSPTPPPAPSYSQTAIHTDSSSTKPLLIFILIVVAVFTGMSISHKMRTGDSLPSKLFDSLKRKPVSKEATQLESSSDSSEDQGQLTE
ncbi:MAG: FHA domain-containing protein [Akkermansiaceae bacterium]